MINFTPPQTPNEKLWYRQPIMGDTVQDATWTITRLDTGEDVPTSLDPPEIADSYAQVLVYGLEDGVDYELGVLITTAGGQVVEGCGLINCRNCS